MFALHHVAALLNAAGNSLHLQGSRDLARSRPAAGVGARLIERLGITSLYRAAALLAPAAATPSYNLGVAAKYRGDWRAALWHSQRAALTQLHREAAWWNVGIAATALAEWPQALTAWQQCGVSGLSLRGPDGLVEVRCAPATACVLVPCADGSHTRLWGTRLCPARLALDSVPRPETGLRHGDVLLLDGVVQEWCEGAPVHAPLSLLRRSSFDTYAACVVLPDSEAEERLHRLCDEAGIVVEEWIPAQSTEKAERVFGFAAPAGADPASLLQQWGIEQRRHGYRAWAESPAAG